MSIKNARQDQEPTLKQGQEKDEVYRLGEAVKSVAREMFRCVPAVAKRGGGAEADLRLSLSQPRLLEVGRPSDSLRFPEQRKLRRTGSRELPADLMSRSQLQFIAATYLDVATFQVSYSLKIVTTAIFSVLFLGRRLSPRKWLSLFVLTAGVAIVWLQSFEGTEEAMHSAGTPGRGLIAVAVACVTHGLAVVYFEL